MNRPSRLLPPALLAVALAAFLPGCNILGAVAVLFRPAVPSRAVHELSDKETVVVIVDDYRGAAISPSLCAGIASAATYHLEHDGKLKVIPAAKVQDAIAKLGDRWTGKRGAAPVSAVSLGAALHADAVVYANVESSQIMVADQVRQPQVQLSVKVYAADGTCRFPVMPDGDNIRQTGFVIQSDVPARDLSASGRGATGLAESKLIAQAGLDLAQLFYDHQPQDKYEKLGQ